MNHDQDDVVPAYAGSLVTAEMYHAALKEAGITSRVVGTELAGSFGSALPSAVELWVHRSDLPKAAAVIERESRANGEPEHAHFPHPTDAPNPAPQPPRRESYVNPNF